MADLSQNKFTINYNFTIEMIIYVITDLYQIFHNEAIVLVKFLSIDFIKYIDFVLNEEQKQQ